MSHTKRSNKTLSNICYTKKYVIINFDRFLESINWPRRQCIGLSLLILAIKKCLLSFFFTLNLPEILLLYSVVCVAGAGRGPLVTRCIKALDRANREATVLVVEKNPSAFVTYVHL